MTLASRASREVLLAPCDGVGGAVAFVGVVVVVVVAVTVVDVMVVVAVIDVAVAVVVPPQRQAYGRGQFDV